MRSSLIVLFLLVAWSPTRAQDRFGPSIEIIGFTDVNYQETERDGDDEGFTLGQLVAHGSARLTERLSFFGEVSATARPDRYQIEVERSFARWDFNDHVKVSGGRYHTPLGYWNTAYHHGLWLQTTIDRPRMVAFGTELLPVHFVGAMVEGSFPGSRSGLSYTAAIGNGRGDDLSRAGDASDANDHRAWLARLTSRPLPLDRLELGAAVYGDRADAAGDVRVDEIIAAAHAVWHDEHPEVISEYARIHHDSEIGGEFDTDAWYVQLAARLPEPAASVKPYVRIERVDVPVDDPLLDAADLDYEAVTGGVRIDVATLAALKAEIRSEEFRDADRLVGLYLQFSLAFGPFRIGDEGIRP